MADTLDRQWVTNDQYHSVNTLFGIPVGTEIYIQNQTKLPMQITTSVTKPVVTADNFILFGPYPMPPVNVASGESEVWVYGNGFINVQTA